MMALHMIPVMVIPGVLLMCIATLLAIAAIAFAVMRNFNRCRTAFFAATGCLVSGGILLMIAIQIVNSV